MRRVPESDVLSGRMALDLAEVTERGDDRLNAGTGLAGGYKVPLRGFQGKAVTIPKQFRSEFTWPVGVNAEKESALNSQNQPQHSGAGRGVGEASDCAESCGVAGGVYLTGRTRHTTRQGSGIWQSEGRQPRADHRRI
jgi:hypothetical protein